jgi:hypothetical protein
MSISQLFEAVANVKVVMVPSPDCCGCSCDRVQPVHVVSEAVVVVVIVVAHGFVVVVEVVEHGLTVVDEVVVVVVVDKGMHGIFVVVDVVPIIQGCWLLVVTNEFIVVVVNEFIVVVANIVADVVDVAAVTKMIQLSN